MKTILLSIVLGFGLLTVLPAAPADADFGTLVQIEQVGFDAADSFVGGINWGAIFRWFQNAFGGNNGGGGGSADVPELDMNFAGAAIVLLLGGVAYMASRRREQE